MSAKAGIQAFDRMPGFPRSGKTALFVAGVSVNHALSLDPAFAILCSNKVRPLESLLQRPALNDVALLAVRQAVAAAADLADHL